MGTGDAMEKRLRLVAHFRSCESGHMSSQTETDQVEVAVLGARHVVQLADQLAHVTAHQSRVVSRTFVVGQIGSVLPVDAYHVDIFLQCEHVKHLRSAKSLSGRRNLRR